MASKIVMLVVGLLIGGGSGWFLARREVNHLINVNRGRFAEMMVNYRPDMTMRAQVAYCEEQMKLDAF